jgi:hypothetical protein
VIVRLNRSGRFGVLMDIPVRARAMKRDHQMLNETFMRAVVEEKARRRDEIANVHHLRLSAPALRRRPVRRRRFSFSRPSWAWRSWRRAVKRRELRPGIPDPHPALRRMRDDVFAP